MREETRCRHIGSFICTIPQTGLHIPWPLLHQSWIHHERTLLPRSYILLLLKSRILNIFITAIHITLILNLSPNNFFSIYHLTIEEIFVLGCIIHSIGHSFVLIVWWVVRWILHGGPIELIFVPPSAPRLVITKIVLGTILSGMVYIKFVPM